jgi:hypothetical protein
MEAQTKKLIGKIETRITYILITLGIAAMIFGITHLSNM